MAGLDTLTLKATPWKVVNLANLKRENKLHLPDLQRGFVWAADRVRALHDSLYRRYPVGALLLWKPTWQGSEAPFATRAWDLFPPDPSTGRGVLEPATAIQPGSLFVLDGQQRLTSILRVIYRSRMRDRTTPDPDLLVALSPNQDWVEDPFHLRSRGLHRRMKDGLLVPAEVLFEGVRGGNESLAIQKAIGEWLTASDEMFFKAFDRANAIRNSILQAEIIAYEIDADADDDNVIEIFARLNQQGVRLRPGDLAAARLTGQMSNFRARARAVFDLPELAGFAVPEGKEQSGRSGSFVDTDLLIRTAMQVSSGVVRYRDAEKQEARAPYEKIEGGWNQTVEGFKGAIQMYRSAGVPSGDWLPYRYLLLPPAVASAKGHVLQRKWLGWAVAASLWGHYAGETETKLQRDANLAEKGDVDGVIEQVKTRAKRTESAIPDEEDFLHNIVGEGGVFLAMLMMFQEKKARSFPGGKLITGADEPLEVHHIFPRAILDLYGKRDNEFVPDRPGNLTILTRSDNEHLSDTPPLELFGDRS
ncbi:MAG: DUF262 domain-containing protein [Planctomycetaceae bacterium]|nr:DUF262 domain-containing protein [Planctomycetaceae bacterium]